MTSPGVPAFHIRRLVPADLELLQSLSRLFASVSRSQRGGEIPPRPAYLDRLLHNPDFVALVALHDGQLLGGLIAYEEVRFDGERSEFCVSDLAVREESRRKGVATALVEEMRRVAAANAAERVYVRANRRDRQAVAFLASVGQREEVVQFDLGKGPAGS